MQQMHTYMQYKQIHVHILACSVTVRQKGAVVVVWLRVTVAVTFL
jgi:hypothetical protein